MTDLEIEHMAAVLEPRIRQMIVEELAKQMASGAVEQKVSNKHGLLNFVEASRALLPMKVSVRSLRRYASAKMPKHKRLRVVRMGHRTVGIRPADLEVWKARCAGELL